MSQRLVVKFGGTSVGSASAIGQAAEIVRTLQTDGRQVAVVTSAMSGVTDALLNGAAMAVSGRAEALAGVSDTLRSKHENAASELGSARSKNPGTGSGL